MSGENGNQSVQQMTSNPQQIGTPPTSSGQMAVTSQVQVQQQSQSSPVQQQGVQQQPQQLHLQASTGTLHHQNQGGNPMQQIQIIPQQLQNQYLQQLYNPQSGQLLMPGNLIHQGMNPQIQIIQKPYQQNQLGSGHMLTTATASYTAIPTSNANNNSYILGQLINSQPMLQQHQQGGKPGDIQKILSPQIGTQLQQGIWTTPQFLPQNIYFQHRPQQDQQQVFIQPQQQQHSHFSMPLAGTTSQMSTTSISPITTATTIQQNTIQQSPPTAQQNIQQQNQTQNPIQTQGNIISIKAPATLQPKPPLQIQPQPTPQQQQQLQMQQHIQQVSMHPNTQIQMISQPQTSIPQSISITHQQQQPQTLTSHVVQNQQQRQVTILPQQTQIQPQSVQVVQAAQQPQPIRPNTSTSVSVATSGQSQMTPPVTTPRPAKIRKPAVSRSNGTPTSQQPGQKQVFPRMPPNQINSSPVTTQPRQIQPSQGQGITLQPLTRIPIVSHAISQQQQNMNQPLKTINLSALQPPNLPDATLTPLTPQSNPLQSVISVQPQPISQQLQQIVFQTNTTQLPSPNVSITPTNSFSIGGPPHKKEESATESCEIKTDPEKENNKSTDEDESAGKQKLPKAQAMVKPQILTHIIEGFVIQEAAEPFPMQKIDLDEPPKKKMALSGETAKCEMCGTVDLKAKFKKNKRFCSSACAKGMKNVQQKHQQQQAQIGTKPALPITNNSTDKITKGKGRKWELGDGDLTDETNSSTGDLSTLSPNDDHMEDELKVNPVKWNVTEVVEFVKSLPGCSEYANDFLEHEIDGQALLLLKEDHLMSAMNMKLGPALKLCAKIEYIRSSSNGESSRT